MELFPNGAFVRLRSRARGKYVHADEDATSVSLRPLGAAPSLNAVWKVELWPAEGGNVSTRWRDPLILLQGAAYGRYLAVAHEDEAPPPSGHRGVRAVQRDYDSIIEGGRIRWWAVWMHASQQDYVRLHNDHLRCLRANGRYRYWNNGVTVDLRNLDETAMMHWKVEAIPSTPVPLPLPPPPPPQPPVHVRRGLFRRHSGHDVQPHPGRTIQAVRWTGDANFPYYNWPDFVFYGNSVSNLRTQLAHLEGVENDENITLCVQPGMNARVTPLVTNLPNNVDPMEIIIYTTGSPAAAQLRYPQFDQPGA